MSFDRIFCVSKTTTYEINHENEEKVRKFEGLPALMQKRIRESHERHRLFLANLREDFEDAGVRVEYLKEDGLDLIAPEKNDLVISCGGDGTFLSCAQNFPDSLLLGTNSDYRDENPKMGSLGALTSVDRRNLPKMVAKLLSGGWKSLIWRRLGAKINGRQLNRLAVNEIFFGSKLPYLTCEMRIAIQRMDSAFLSSGLICCTGMGSHAWFAKAGGTPFSNELDAFGVMVLWPNRNHNNSQTAGIFSDRHTLKIRPNRDGYVLAFDSKTNTIETSLDDHVEIYLDEERPLKVIGFT